MASTCKVTGSLATLPGMDAAAICDRFARGLAAGLGDSALPQDLAITLTLHPRGAIDARLARGGEAYPVISVDALDRVLQPDDLDRLARTAVQVLADPSSRSAAHLKRK
jgi:hypothetical protein